MFDTNIGFGYALISSILRILPEKAAFFRFKTQPERERHCCHVCLSPVRDNYIQDTMTQTVIGQSALIQNRLSALEVALRCCWSFSVQ